MNKSPYDIGCSGYYFHDFFFFFFFRFFSWIATYEVYICFKFLWIFRIKRLMKNLNYLCLLVMDSGTLYLTRLISLHLSLSLSLSHTHTPPHVHHHTRHHHILLNSSGGKSSVNSTVDTLNWSTAWTSH